MALRRIVVEHDAVFRKPLSFRRIAVEHSAVLHTPCREVCGFDSKLKILVDDLLETLYSTKNAVGLAAPQVGILKQVAVVDVGEGPVVLINPEIVEKSGSEIAQEGCLSFPNVWVDVSRPTFVKVKSFDENGEELYFIGKGLKARAFCHEIDHLHGVVFLDRAIRK